MMMYVVQPQLWQTKTFWSVFEAKKKFIDANFDDENEMSNAAPVPTSSEMRNVTKSALTSREKCERTSDIVCCPFQKLLYQLFQDIRPKQCSPWTSIIRR
ncbi:hypothetical protein TNCV_2161211 [Trichonephila clavipes]|nr:hypothetical protein TNCV_2161211 [Trichonephila clavipes]